MGNEAAVLDEPETVPGDKPGEPSQAPDRESSSIPSDAEQTGDLATDLAAAGQTPAGERPGVAMGGDTLAADVLVVGAGPGGSAAAYHLARHGADVLLVDRATFPRDKVCGDGLTPRGVAGIERMGVAWRDSPSFARAHGGLSGGGGMLANDQ